jgi:hypothetical protein
MLNAPVFEWDSYWLSGHGHSTYRFVAGNISRGSPTASAEVSTISLTIWYDMGRPAYALVRVVRPTLASLRAIAAASLQYGCARGTSGLQAALFGLASLLFGEFRTTGAYGFFSACCGVCLAAARTERALAARGVVINR